MSAGNNAVLKAEGDIVLQAARNTFEQKTDSKSSSASIGIGYSTGGQQVRIMLDTQGKVQRSAVQFSSGNDSLDQAAITASAEVRMIPAMQDGTAVPSQAMLLFDYKLDAR